MSNPVNWDSRNSPGVTDNLLTASVRPQGQRERSCHTAATGPEMRPTGQITAHLCGSKYTVPDPQASEQRNTTSLTARIRASEGYGLGPVPTAYTCFSPSSSFLGMATPFSYIVQQKHGSHPCLLIQHIESMGKSR